MKDKSKSTQEKKEIYEKADENLENIISVFLSEFNGYKIKFM